MTCKTTFIFDFDGTLINSNEIKLRLFDFVFPELCIHDLRYMIKSLTGNRYDIIKELDLKVSDNQRVFELTDRMQLYDKISVDALVVAEEVLGATQFLNILLEKGLKIYISSATPEKVMFEILKRRGWLHYFNGIFGSPSTKQSHISKIKKSLSTVEQIIYFGDSEIDFCASAKCNINFFGMFISGNKPEWFFGDQYSNNYINILKKMRIE